MSLAKNQVGPSQHKESVIDQSTNHLLHENRLENQLIIENVTVNEKRDQFIDPAKKLPFLNQVHAD